MVNTDPPPSSGYPPQIPGYELLEMIGEGGMGEVYRAVQVNLQRPVAIKFLGPRTTQAPMLAFQRESRLMAALTHPNVVAIHDCGQVDGHFFLIMEFVAGTNLHGLMKAGEPWPVDKAMPVMAAILNALAYIHERGILHLDLKPENVLCGDDGSIKITDFGLAVPSVDTQSSTDRGWMAATIDYSAPEQRYGLPVDQRSDLFAVSTIIYELLTGQLPGRVYIPASQRNPQLPEALDEVLRKGLARDRDDRFASVRDFSDALHDALKPRKERWFRWPKLGVYVAS
ncbi:MAG: serine/threonine-protein kinase [Gemmataceae bacterium]